MLNRQSYFIREHVGIMKLTDTYDILDPETRQQIGIAKEKLGLHFQLLRLVLNKRLLPTTIFVYEGPNPDDESKLLFSIQRGMTFFRSKVNICDRNGTVVGWLRSKAFSLGGAFYVFDAADNEVAFVKGDWKGWNFRFLDKGENELGTITKKWAGIGKELFTTADNYIIALNDEPEPAKAILLLAAGLAVDMVYKEAEVARHGDPMSNPWSPFAPRKQRDSSRSERRLPPPKTYDNRHDNPLLSSREGRSHARTRRTDQVDRYADPAILHAVLEGPVHRRDSLARVLRHLDHRCRAGARRSTSTLAMARSSSR